MRLRRNGTEVTLRDWGRQLMADMQPIAGILDKANESQAYTEVLAAMQLRIEDDSSTPAATLLREMVDNNESYFGIAMRKAQEQRDYFLQRPPNDDTIAKYQQLAQDSIHQQTEIEASDNVSFDEFLANYG